MYDSELIFALRQLKVNTKSLACLGCRYGHDCGVHGCHLIGMAADRIAELRFRKGMVVSDFEICADLEELKATMDYINRHGYDVISVTQDAIGVYTVFFKCRARMGWKAQRENT